MWIADWSDNCNRVASSVKRLTFLANTTLTRLVFANNRWKAQLASIHSLFLKCSYYDDL